jgi:hypothetical protein
MNSFTDLKWIKKTRFLPRCPWTMESCDPNKCQAAQSFSWNNVFISIPFKENYKTRRDAIKNVMKENHLFPIMADELSGLPLSKDICMNICRSAHAIVDFSNPGEKFPATGVLTENGILRSTMYNILNLVDNKMENLPAEIQTSKYQRYSDNNIESMINIIKKWIESDIKLLIESVRNLIIPNNGYESKIIYHCKRPFSDYEKSNSISDPPEPSLSGGCSGLDILENLFNSCGYRNYSIVCTEDEMLYEDKNNINKIIDAVKDKYARHNLFLLDAPFHKEKLLNWVLHGLINEEKKNRKGKANIRLWFDDMSEDEMKKKPGEEKKITVNGRSVFASFKYDYGIITKIPNPFNEDTVVMIMAGLHAPSSHAAVQNITNPFELSSLMNRFGFWQENIPNEFYFELLFQVNRTYKIELLGSPLLCYHHTLFRK